MSETTLKGADRNYSDFEGSQVVVTRPSGIGTFEGGQSVGK
jgi:hypothetical protein